MKAKSTCGAVKPGCEATAKPGRREQGGLPARPPVRGKEPARGGVKPNNATGGGMATAEWRLAPAQGHPWKILYG